MSNIVFGDEMGRMQRAIAETHDLVVRRNMVMEALKLRTGEKVLELGCGGVCTPWTPPNLSAAPAMSTQSTSARTRSPRPAIAAPVFLGCNARLEI